MQKSPESPIPCGKLISIIFKLGVDFTATVANMVVLVAVNATQSQGVTNMRRITKTQQATDALIAAGVVENRSHAFAILEDAGLGSATVFNKAVKGYEAHTGRVVGKGGARHTSAAEQQRREDQRTYSNSLATLPAADWENQAGTCAGFDFTAACPSTDQTSRARAFIPTSMIVSGAAPVWKIRQAVDAALTKAQGSYDMRLLPEGGIGDLFYSEMMDAAIAAAGEGVTV